jgi:nucleoside-diphosphate-sugar epimerase
VATDYRLGSAAALIRAITLCCPLFDSGRSSRGRPALNRPYRLTNFQRLHRFFQNNVLVARERGGLELSVFNPVGVLGPVLGSDYSTSILLVQRLLDGAMPGCPKLYLGVVDERDVADIHLRAMTNPAAKGERFLATAGDFMSMRDIAKVLKDRLGAAAKRVPTRELPSWLVRIGALRDPAIKLILPELGQFKNATNEKATRLLGWKPRSREEAVVATAESLVRLGLVKP